MIYTGRSIGFEGEVIFVAVIISGTPRARQALSIARQLILLRPDIRFFSIQQVGEDGIARVQRSFCLPVEREIERLSRFSVDRLIVSRLRFYCGIITEEERILPDDRFLAIGNWRR